VNFFLIAHPSKTGFYTTTVSTLNLCPVFGGKLRD